jgi:hypothetical protein
MNTGVYLPSKILPAFVVVFTFSSCKTKRKQGKDADRENLSGSYTLASLTYKPNTASAAQDHTLLLDEPERHPVTILHVNRLCEDEDTTQDCLEQEDPGIKGNLISSEGIMDGVIQQFDNKGLVFYRPDFYMPGDRLVFTMKKRI